MPRSSVSEEGKPQQLSVVRNGFGFFPRFDERPGKMKPGVSILNSPRRAGRRGAEHGGRPRGVFEHELGLLSGLDLPAEAFLFQGFSGFLNGRREFPRQKEPAVDGQPDQESSSGFL